MNESCLGKKTERKITRAHRELYNKIQESSCEDIYSYISNNMNNGWENDWLLDDMRKIALFYLNNPQMIKNMCSNFCFKYKIYSHERFQ